ncbi:hypothetical protein [uncultured Nocardioides sp.]|jgi:hypothetical protein|uniref:hypothetical protein n=1 Tax=uncultured Nocardioides sp. TaxID=198441 RepID=UPI000C4F8C7A|nr:hypothetical protein [uncultured Nocardioides sp.]MAO81732.1 hypothetical protein [Nocardioides sp.]
MMFRALATGLTVTGLVALGVGPVRVALDRNPGVVEEAGRPPIVLSSSPGAAPAWATGSVDTARQLPGDGPRRVAKPERVDLTAALELLDDADTLSVVGGSEDVRLPGVGVVVTEAEAERLIEVPEPRRTRLLSHVVDTEQMGLAVFAVGAAPEKALVVDGDSGPGRRAKLRKASEPVADVVEGWAQLRPDLRALVNRGRTEAAPRTGEAPLAEPGERSWERTVDRVVRREVLPALDEGRAPLAPALIDGEDALVLLGEGPARMTARGAAYAVAARAVQPGSRLLPTRGGEVVDARVLQRPDGRVAVLAWNDGPATTLTVQVPEGDRVLRYRLRLPGHALTASVLRR